VIEEITPRAAERLEFYGQPLAVGDRVTHCPDIVLRPLLLCTHVQGYVWCDPIPVLRQLLLQQPRRRHLLGGWASTSTSASDHLRLQGA
jgi:hypothetical protein